MLEGHLVMVRIVVDSFRVWTISWVDTSAFKVERLRDLYMLYRVCGVRLALPG